MFLSCNDCERMLRSVGCITRANGELVCKKNGCPAAGIERDDSKDKDKDKDDNTRIY